jgi:hypothetical protein
MMPFVPEERLQYWIDRLEDCWTGEYKEVDDAMREVQREIRSYLMESES